MKVLPKAEPKPILFIVLGLVALVLVCIFLNCMRRKIQKCFKKNSSSIDQIGAQTTGEDEEVPKKKIGKIVKSKFGDHTRVISQVSRDESIQLDLESDEDDVDDKEDEDENEN